MFVLFLIALVGVWFWSLGSLPPEAEPQAALSEVEGLVTVTWVGESEREARTGMTLSEGMTIVTGPDSKATLDWFGESETRLGPSSRLTVAHAQNGNDGPFVVRLRLETGRAWTRVLRLLDIDADVSVETNDVVATVRGTSFDVETVPGSATTIWVADAVVEVSGAIVGGAADGFFVPEGSMAEFVAGRRTTSTRPLDARDRKTDWFRNNREADLRFRERVALHMNEALATDRASAGSMRGMLTGWSERMRVAFASGEHRERLANRYRLRRLMAVRRAAESGKSGLAYQEFARMDGEMKTQMGRADEGPNMRKMVSMAQRLFEDVQPSSPAYRIKQQVEVWAMQAAPLPAERLHARLMIIDERLDESVSSLEADDRETASQVLVLARQGLANVERERREAEGVTQDHAERLRKVWKALSVRADALDARLKTLDEPVAHAPAESIEETEEAVPTSTPPAPLPVVATSTPPAPPSEPQAPLKPVSMTVTPGVFTIGFYERVTYRAIVVYDTGLTRDVTRSARFTMSPTGYGSLFDNVFSAFDLRGTITVTAAFEEAGVPLQAGATLTIEQR